jgi:hypothetical protein
VLIPKTVKKNGEQKYISTIHNHMKVADSKVAGRSLLIMDLYGKTTVLETCKQRMRQGHIAYTPVSPNKEKYTINLPCSTASIGSSIIEFVCLLSEEETGRTDDITPTGATKSIRTASAELVLSRASLVPAAERSAWLALHVSATLPGDSSVSLE